MNALINIVKICKEAIAGNERPDYLKRSVRPLSGTASVITPTIYSFGNFFVGKSGVLDLQGSKSHWFRYFGLCRK